jgi:hypothetical protein
MTFQFGKAHDYNDFVAQVRGFVQGHPQVLKSDPKDPQSGVTITGTGDGELYVSTESYTPAGAAPTGTTYRLTCTVAGSEVSSPRAQFTVEQLGVSPSVLGTLTAGERFVPEGDDPQFNPSPLASPAVGIDSPQHGLRLFLTTSTDWAVSDTIEVVLVDSFIGRNASDNWVEQRYVESDADVNGNFTTEWIARAPTIAGAGNSPESTVFYGMLTSFNVPGARYNVGLMGADGYEPSSAFAGQPNSSGLRYAFLDDSPFPFWIVANADGLYVVARPSTVYQHMTLQIIDVFATGNQHPKPSYVGAMSEVDTTNFTETDNDLHAAWWDPGNESSARFRWVDGTWYNIENRTSNYSKGVISTRWLQPYKHVSNEAGWQDESFPLGLSWARFSRQLIDRYDGSYELLPVTLTILDPQSAVVGDLKFIKYTTGFGINSEDTTTDSSVSPAVEYIAFQNAQLTAPENYCVMELEE